jgi:hypothetical protein
LAAGAWDSIGQPISEALYLLRNAAAEAGNAVASIAGALEEIKAMNGLVSTVTIITRHIDIYEERHESGGAGGGGPGGRQFGGPVMAGMPYVVGEVGPELFVPESNGQVVSNNAFNLNIYTSAPTEDILADFGMLKALAA